MTTHPPMTWEITIPDGAPLTEDERTPEQTRDAMLAFGMFLNLGRDDEREDDTDDDEAAA